MTPAQLRRLLVAPEIVVVDLVRHALGALRLALLAEHPLLADDLAPNNDPPVQRRARAVLNHAQRLRRELEAYRRQVRHVLRELPGDDLPF
jgi:hypothetical protein